MISTVFGWIQTVFTFMFGALNNVWTSIGGIRYLFYGVFLMVLLTRFFLIPLLGRQGFTLPGWSKENRPEEKERYQNTGIGFTARW